MRSKALKEETVDEEGVIEKEKEEEGRINTVQVHP